MRRLIKIGELHRRSRVKPKRRVEAEIDYLGERRYETVEPLTNYFALRLQKDYNQGSTFFGGMFTAAMYFNKIHLQVQNLTCLDWSWSL